MTGGIAVILGNTGRNFAAGMSGGIAYVLDRENRFSHYCNKELVDFDEMELEDISVLNGLIENHYQYTGSTVAKDILDNWQLSLTQFVKVMPRDYKRVLLRNKGKLEKAI